MFWRRSRKPSDGAARDGASHDDNVDDLTKLQRQFGIKTVSDKDVEADFLKLLGGTGGGSGTRAATNTGGSGLGLSPRTELALFGGSGQGDSDEEAQILRQLNLSGDLDSIDADALSGADDDDDDDEEDGDGARLAKRELQGVLGDVHREAKRNAERNDPLRATTATPHMIPPAALQPLAVGLSDRIHAMKLQAVALKREGKIQEALAVFRDVKVLEAQLANGATATATTSSMTAVATATNGTSVVAHTQSVTTTVVNTEAEDVDEKDVDVTDEDMENPEYLAQLAALGLAEPTPAKPVETIESLERAIRESKERAVQLKRSDRIADALAEMRTFKAMEARLTELRARATPTATHPDPTASDRVAAIPPVVAVASPLGIAPAEVIVTLPEPTNDSDVEVTDEDLNDPAFAAELQKMGFDIADMNDSEEEEENESDTPPSLTEPVPSEASATENVHSYANRYSSIDDSDLIDEFEDSDEERDEEEKASVPNEMNARQSVLRMAASTGEETKGPNAAPPVNVPGPQVSFETTESERVEIREASNGASIDELQMQLEKTKLSAVQYKREGNIQAALDMMRRMKQIENLIEMKRRHVAPVTLPPSPEDVERMRRFNELEALLVQFANDATREAKEQLSVNRAKAAEWLAKRKEYSAHLAVLREKRQILGQEPPSFQVDQLREQIEIEHTEIPMDEVHMRVESVNDLGQAAGKDVFVKFNLSFPSSAPHEGKTGTFRLSHNPPFSGRVTSDNAFRVKIQRGRGTQRLFEIKKAVFEVWRPGSLLRNPELVVRGYQELAPLLTTSEVKSRVVFVGSNRKPVGGDVEISLRLRTPLRDKEFKTLVSDVLRIGEYPPPQMPAAAQQVVSRLAARSEPASPTRSQHARPHSQSEVPARASTEKTKAPPLPHVMSAPALPTSTAPSTVFDTSALEDPHDLDLIVSYDVIIDEIQRIEAVLPNLQGDMAAEYSDRLDSLGLKKQLLEIDMQTGKLTLDVYVARLKQRILDDRAIIKSLLKSARKPDAARVLHRVKVMEKELVGAEDEEGTAEE